MESARGERIQLIETLADHAIVNGTEEAVLIGDDLIETDSGERIPVRKDPLDGEKPADGASARITEQLGQRREPSEGEPRRSR